MDDGPVSWVTIRMDEPVARVGFEFLVEPDEHFMNAQEILAVHESVGLGG